MQIKHSFQTALTAIFRHQSRSILTVLGIVIGITSIILVMSVGEGAQQMILGQIESMGSQMIIVEPGRMPEGPSDFAELYTDSLSQRDIKALKNPINVRGLKILSPMVVSPATLSYEHETKRASVWGTDEYITKIMKFYPQKGRYFTAEEINQRAKVTILGSEIKKDLFGQSNAIGQKIKVKNITFKVIGVLPPLGTVLMANVDKIIFSPYSTVQKYIMGSNHFQSFMIEAENNASVKRVHEEVKMTLREMHGINDPDKDDFHSVTQADATKRVGTVTSVLTALLMSIAAISLIVGGIGIMNIMFVSVTERTREIGLRKALGATPQDIMIQFLLESTILTIIGGIIGISLGAIFSYLTAIILSKTVASSWSFVFPISAAALGLGVAGTVGLVFGIIPARQAANKNPIEALRYE